MRESEIPGGIKGLWYRLSGKAAQIERTNQERKNQEAYEQYQQRLQLEFNEHSAAALKSIKDAVAIDESLLAKLESESPQPSQVAQEVSRIAGTQQAFLLEAKQDGGIVVNGKRLSPPDRLKEIGFRATGDVDKIGGRFHQQTKDGNLSSIYPVDILASFYNNQYGGSSDRLIEQSVTLISMVNLPDESVALNYTFGVNALHLDHRAEYSLANAIFKLPKVEAYKLYLLMKANPDVYEQFFQEATVGLDQPGYPGQAQQPGIKRHKEGPAYFVRLDKFDPNMFNPYGVQPRELNDRTAMYGDDIQLRYKNRKSMMNIFKNPSMGEFELLPTST